MYSLEYTRVRVRVLACDSRVTREGCQVAHERHCTTVHMGYSNLSTQLRTFAFRMHGQCDSMLLVCVCMLEIQTCKKPTTQLEIR